MTVRILKGDCRTILRELPEESVHCVVTSPPYWGLRDYGVDGQLGMERTLGEHVETMVVVFSEVRRVLRSDGTLWLNYGDSYAASPNGRTAAEVKALGNDDRTFRDKPFSTIGPVFIQDGGQVPDNKNVKARAGQSGNKGNPGSDFGGRIFAGGFLKPKDLCGIPWRIALALQTDGWWLRQDIIWSKPNPMPESVKDRCTKAHEYLFLLAKGQRYYFDADAIAEPFAPATAPRALRGQESDARAKGVPGQSPHGLHEPRSYKGSTFTKGKTAATKPDVGQGARTEAQGRNKRSVWEIATSPYADAHFATFPAALIEPCILAGCPKGGTVLDPFGGAGTTGMVADRLGRDAILIELNPEYAAMAERRIKNDAGMFADVHR